PQPRQHSSDCGQVAGTLPVDVFEVVAGFGKGISDRTKVHVADGTVSEAGDFSGEVGVNLNVIEARLRREYELPDDFKFYAWKCYP
ncbi:hypothetical protein, partial [Erwinia amylovora]|uniref:hypothetical protein n=1 Tax=Erwinia amylovora TaxID=552 RepID=UPI0020C0B153